MPKRLLALLLCLVMILGTLASCANRGEKGGTGETTGLDVTVTSDPSFDTSEPQRISLAEYCVIHPARMSSALTNAIDSLESVLKDALGSEPASNTDRNVADSETATEIVIGEVTRAEITDAKYDLRDGDYLIRYNPQSRRILILGSSNARTVDAVKYVAENLIDKEDCTLNLPAGGTYYGLAEYPIRTFEIDGVNISRYTVVVPQDADLLTYNAGVNLVDYFTQYMGYTLPMVTDKAAETAYEILLGDTNRAESDVTCALSDGQYAMFLKNSKLVLQGKTYMIGGGFGMLVKECVDLGKTNAMIRVSGFSDAPVAKDFVYAETCTNAILMIGDGMGYGQIEMALENGLDTFVAQLLPHAGESVTRSQSVINGSATYTDSAAAATALACGYKTLNRRIGYDSSGTRVFNVREIAHAYGAQTAVVTTDVITGATPGGFLGHVTDRDHSTELQAQIDLLIADKRIDYCMGSVDDELYFHTRGALMEISDSTDPFFIMIEEGYIDKHCHWSDIKSTYDTVVRFNEAIAYAIGFTLCHPGTALIVTADHETGGLTRADSISDLNGVLSAEYRSAHYNKIVSDIEKFGYSYTAFKSATNSGCNHTNVNVPLYAMGPGTEMFNGTATENIEIAKFIARAFGEESFGQK